MKKGRVLTGARARLMLNGKKVGYATNVSFSEELQQDPVEVLDNIEVEEFVPVGYRVTLTASLVRIFGETVKSAGYFPAHGKSSEEFLQNVLVQGDLVAVLEDNKNKKAFMTCEQVKMASQNITVNARGIVGQDVTFVGVRIKDESET